MRVLFATLRRQFVGSQPRPPALNSLVGLLYPRKYEAEMAFRCSSASILGPDLPDVWKHLSSASPTLPSAYRNQGDDGLNPTIINGKIIAEEIKSGIATEIRQMKDATGKVPGLAMVLVGKRRDSESYVRCKINACEEVGITSLLAELPEDCPQDDVVNVVSNFNNDPSVHGILVQLPLPKDPRSEHGYYLTGDVCYEEALQLVSAITPVPGGVGPVTVAMLLSNTVDSAKRAFGR